MVSEVLDYLVHNRGSPSTNPSSSTEAESMISVMGSSMNGGLLRQLVQLGAE